MSTTRTGYVPQFRWADQDMPHWIDLGEVMHPSQASAQGYSDSVTGDHNRRVLAGKSQRHIAGTRVVKRTITDEVCE